MNSYKSLPLPKNQNLKEMLKASLTNPNSDMYIRNSLDSMFSRLEAPNPTNLTNNILAIAMQDSMLIDEYEQRANKLIEEANIEEKIASALCKRTAIIYKQIKEHLPQEGKVLDLGCGNGMIGAEIAAKSTKYTKSGQYKSGLEVTLADVYRDVLVEALMLDGMEYIKIKEGKPFQVDNQAYDATLLLTVLHHCNNPLKTLMEARRATKKSGSIIVIESVYGIKDNSQFGKLMPEEQKLANIFFDHFYNRIVHYTEKKKDKINIPFNFNTPKGWKEIFEKNGLRQVYFKPLGIDQLLVPEYHTLHILNLK